MKKIELDYQDFIDVVNNRRVFIQYENKTVSAGDFEPEVYNIWATDEDITYETTIIKDASKYNIVGVDDSQEQANQDDFENNHKPDANRPHTIAKSSTQSKFLSKQIELADGETSGYTEWSFDDTVYLRKVLTIPINAEWGDYVDLSIISKSDDSFVKSYGENIYLYNDRPSKWFSGNGAGKILDIYKVRCHYNNPSGNPKKFIITVEFLV